MMANNVKSLAVIINILVLLVFFSLTGCQPEESEKEITLTVYSARKEHLIKPLFDLYTQQTGVKIQYITDNAGPLLVRLESEKNMTPADILMTVDAGNLWQAGEKDLLQSVQSDILTTNIPSHLQDSQQRWFGLSIRARTIVYATDRVCPDELSTYEGLAEPEWQGRVCLRTAKKVYNQSLVATMIDQLGEEKTEQVVRGWVANLATDVFSNDTAVMEAIIAGQCDVGIVNSYYFGRLIKKNPALALALFWPNQQGRGVHVNVSGAGVTRYTKYPEEALKLLEWLSGEQAQRLFADLNQEYPVNSLVVPAPEVVAWGDYQKDTVKVEVAGKLQVDAIKLMDRVGYR